MDDDGLPGYTPRQTEVNVLVVGETQQGKSSLIKRISEYAGISDLDIGIGDGNLSETKSVNVYPITVTPQEYMLVDTEGKPITGQSFKSMRALTRNQAKIIEVENEDATPVTFNFIDTLGLNDSDGDDMMNMAHIVGKCSQVSHLNALIYVRSVEEPLSKSFQQFFQYLQRCLPTFMNGFIIVHTRYSTAVVAENLRENVDIAKIRREAFQQTINSSLEHFFLDNDPPLRSPFAQVQSLNEISRFLSHLQSQLSMPSTGFKLLKTHNMKNVDIHVRNALNELKINLERERQKEEKIGDAFRSNSVFHQAEISRLKVRLGTLSSQIEGLVNGPNVLLATKSFSNEYTMWGTLVRKQQLRLEEIKADYAAIHPITEVTLSKKSGCQWHDQTLEGNAWKATLRGSAFRDIGGTATFYTSSSIYNQSVITVVRKMETEFTDAIGTHEAAIQRNRAGDEYNEHAERIGANLGKIERTLNLVSAEEFDIGLWQC